ncbi:MAG: murein L,D-transpeptidase catalytic domain family protein [Comamonas sp.]
MTDFDSRRHALRRLARLAAAGGALAGASAPLLAARAASARHAQGADGLLADPVLAITPPPTLVLRSRASAPAQQLASALSASATDLDPLALLLATQALERARSQPGLLDADPARLAVIDYSRPSTDKRLWVFDLRQRRLLHHEWVAHGRNSGDNMTVRFSNVMDSRMSSLGAFAASTPYSGSNGYSLRLRGLEPGFNDRALDRAIVMHGAPYVNEDIIRSQGRLGRSWGCPAVRSAVAAPLIDLLADGGFLFGYYPDTGWLAESRLIGGMAQLHA